MACTGESKPVQSPEDTGVDPSMHDTVQDDTGFGPARATEAHSDAEAQAAIDYRSDGFGPLTGAWFAGDLDGDSLDDILTWDKSSNYREEEISVLQRNLSGAVDPWTGSVLTCPLDDDTFVSYSGRPSAVEDLSGDGQVDLVHPVPDAAGGVWITYGPLRGAVTLQPDVQVTNGSGEDVRFEALAQDMNGDGVADLVVGVRDTTASYASGVHVFEGPVDGDRGFSDASASRLLALGEAWAQFSVADDVDADGVVDLIVGGCSAVEDPDGGMQETCGAWLHTDLSAGSLESSDARARIVDSADGGTAAGSAVELPGDIDGDGKGDILLGGYLSDRGGAVWLIHGAPSGTVDLVDADATLYGKEPCAEAGYALAAAGDTDGDGFADFWVGAPGEDFDRECFDDGHAWLVRGPIEGGFWLPGSDVAITGGGGFGSVLSAHPTDGGLLVGVVHSLGTISLFETAGW